MCLIELLIFHLEFWINNSRISEQGDFRARRVKLKGRNTVWKAFSSKMISSSGSERTRWSHELKLTAFCKVESFEMEKSATSLDCISKMQAQFSKKRCNFHEGFIGGPDSTSFLMRCCTGRQNRSEHKWPRCMSEQRHFLCCFTIAIATRAARDPADFERSFTRGRHELLTRDLRIESNFENFL